MIYLDSHVHFYNIFNISTFFNNTLNNFKSVSNNQDDYFVIVLTESSGYNWFKTFVNYAEDNKILYDWNFQVTGEDVSIKVYKKNELPIYIISGKQFNTKEKLEVLAVGFQSDFDSNITLKNKVGEILNRGGIPILPWGFGKWWGERGKIIKNYLVEKYHNPIFLGDNSGRLRYLPLFFEDELGVLTSYKILPGSDPLPFKTQQKKAGSYGAIIEGEIDPEFPFKSLKNILISEELEIFSYGSLEKLGNFLINQIKMQIHNKYNKKRSYF